MITELNKDCQNQNSILPEIEHCNKEKSEEWKSNDKFEWEGIQNEEVESSELNLEDQDSKNKNNDDLNMNNNPTNKNKNSTDIKSKSNKGNIESTHEEKLTKKILKKKLIIQKKNQRQ